MPSFAIDISTQHSVTGFAASDCTFRIRGVVREIAESLEVLLLDLLHQCYSKSCCKSCQVHTVRYFLSQIAHSLLAVQQKVLLCKIDMWW